MNVFGPVLLKKSMNNLNAKKNISFEKKTVKAAVLLAMLILLVPVSVFSLPKLKKKSKGNEEAGAALKGNPINAIRYIVGDIAITEYDIEQMKFLLARKKAGGGGASLKPVDELIVRAIVEIESRTSSIIVSDAKVHNEIKKRMETSGISNEETFQRIVSQETGLPYEVWVEDMRYQIKRHQLIQIAVPVPQASDAELRRHYYAKMNQIGFEIMYREIVFRPRNSSSAEELRVSQLARNARNDVMKNPGSFERIAKTNPDNASYYKARGGLVGYLPIHEIAQNDRILAGQLFSLTPGRVSPVFRDQGNRYVIVRVEAKRPLPFEKAKPILVQDLYMSNVEKSFDAWIEKRKKEVAIIEIK